MGERPAEAGAVPQAGWGQPPLPQGWGAAPADTVPPVGRDAGRAPVGAVPAAAAEREPA